MSEFLLNEVCELIVDCPHSTAKDEGKGYPLVRTPNIGKGRLVYNGMHRVCEDVYNKRNARAVPQENDLIFAREATAGNVALIQKGEKVCLGQRTVLIRPNQEKVNPAFLTYFLLAPKQQYNLLSTANGATVAHVNLPAIRNLKIDLPELPIQHRIATILSRYDSLIENYQKQIKLLEEAAQRLYKEWFVDLHFPGHENVKIVDGVPEGWEKKTIDDVTCKVTTGLNPRKNFVLGKGSNYYVTIKNMADNTLLLDDRCDRVDNEALEKINKRSDLKIGDILFSGIGTIGRVALVDIPTNNWNVSESVFTLRVNDIVTKEFLYLMLLSPDMQNYCQSNAHGAAQKGIRMADLKAYSFNLPPFGVIQKFTNLVTPIIKKVSSIRNQIRLLTEARDRLLPKLMSGEIEI